MNNEAASEGSPRPAFIGVGAGKCGTTWLMEMLRDHPDIFVPEAKELHYFNDLRFELRTQPNPVAQRPIGWYLSNFAGAAPGAVCGEFSTHYLWNETAASRIHEFNPDAKILVVLRDPVERSHSVHLFAAQRGYLRPGQTFEETWQEFPHIVDRSRYAAALTRFLEYFSAESIHVAFHEDLRRDPVGEVMRIQEFLGVHPLPPAETGRQVNVTGAPRHPRLTRALWKVRDRALDTPAERLVTVAKRLGLQDVYRGMRKVEAFDVKPVIDPRTAARLREEFRDDIEALEEMLGLSLDHWKDKARDQQASEV